MADIQLSKESSTSFRVKLGIKSEEFNKVEKKSIENINAKVKVDGFRKGKVPERIIKTKFKADIIDDMVNVSINENYPEIAKKSPHGIYDIIKFENIQYEDGILKYEFIFETFPYIELGKLKDINIKEHIIQIESKLVDKEIKRLQKNFAEYKPTEDKSIRNSCGVIIDFEIWVDDIPSGEPVKGQRLILGENDFDKDIESEILIQKPGIGQEIKIKKTNTTPETESIKDYKIIVTLVDVLDVILPEFNDEFVAKVDPQALTTEKFRQNIIAQLEKSARFYNLNQEFKIALEKLIEISTFQIPERYVEKRINSFLEERKIQKSDLSEENLKMLKESVVNRIKHQTLVDYIYTEANKDKEDSSYRANFKLFLKQNFPDINSDVILKLYDDVMAQKNQLPEAFYKLLNDYLDEYNHSLIEKFFKEHGVFKKGKKLEFEEMQNMYKTEMDQNKKKK